jgi:hypothetical protein
MDHAGQIQRQRLLECDDVQGRCLGRPMAVGTLEAWWAKLLDAGVERATAATAPDARLRPQAR